MLARGIAPAWSGLEIFSTGWSIAADQLIHLTSTATVSPFAGVTATPPSNSMGQVKSWSSAS